MAYERRGVGDDEVFPAPLPQQELPSSQAARAGSRAIGYALVALLIGAPLVLMTIEGISDRKRRW